MMTRRSRDMQLKVKKNEFLNVFSSQNILTKMYESVFFQLKNLVKATLENFSDLVSRCLSYLKAFPNIHLSV